MPVCCKLCEVKIFPQMELSTFWWVFCCCLYYFSHHAPGSRSFFCFFLSFLCLCFEIFPTSGQPATRIVREREDGLLFILETQPHEDNRCEWTGSSFYAAVLPGRSLHTFFFLCAATVSIGGEWKTHYQVSAERVSHVPRREEMKKRNTSI